MSSNHSLRSQIENLEADIRSQRDRLAELRRQAARGTVEDYRFLGPDGREVRLSQLFGDHDDLITIHNMGADCAYCTLWADGFNGMLPHFQSRAALVLVSPDTPEQQQRFALDRGWDFTMVSDDSREFTEDMGFFREWQGEMGPWPGFSTFHRQPDGSIQHVASDSYGPGDVYCGIWNMFELLAGGAGDWQPRHSYELTAANLATPE